MKNYVIVLAAATMVVACGTPKNTYYTLNAPAVPPTSAMKHKTRIMVGPVTLPSSVDSHHLVTMDSGNQVTVYEYQRWAGSLKSDIEKLVAANLAQDLSTPNVWSYGQTTYAAYDYRVFMDVQSLDSKMGDAVTLDVLWTVKPAAAKAKATGGHDAAINGRSLIKEPVSENDFNSLVAAQSRAFDRVSDEIAKAIHVH